MVSITITEVIRALNWGGGNYVHIHFAQLTLIVVITVAV